MVRNCALWLLVLLLVSVALPTRQTAHAAPVPDTVKCRQVACLNEVPGYYDKDTDKYVEFGVLTGDPNNPTFTPAASSWGSNVNQFNKKFFNMSKIGAGAPVADGQTLIGYRVNETGTATCEMGPEKACDTSVAGNQCYLISFTGPGDVGSMLKQTCEQ